MAKGIKPRNYSFLNKFTYFLPGVGHMFVLLVFLFVGALIGGILSTPVLFIFGQEQGLLYAQLISYPVMFIPPMIYASRCSRDNSYTHSGVMLDNKHFSPMNFGVCALLVSLATIALGFCSDALSAVMPPVPEWFEDLMKDMTTGDHLFINFLMVSVFAPFFEEWLCRGMVLRGLLANKIKPVWAIVISSVFFGVIHLNVWQALPAFLIGCLFGFVYYKTGSLKLTMLMHCVNNTFALLMSNLNGFEDVKTWKDVFPGGHYWIIFAAGILLLILIIRAFLRIPQERQEGNMDEVKPLFEE